ncbi:hypothetical protein X975_26556, partial [Stegodyphus mimosarum]
MFLRILCLTALCCFVLTSAEDDFEPTPEHLLSLWLLQNKIDNAPDFTAIIPKMTREEKNNVKKWLDAAFKPEAREDMIAEKPCDEPVC